MKNEVYITNKRDQLLAHGFSNKDEAKQYAKDQKWRLKNLRFITVSRK